MKVLFFAPSHAEGNRRINELIDSFTELSGLEIYRTIESLSHRLCQPYNNTNVVAVLFATNLDTLSELMSLKDLLGGIRLILVLPDRQAKTIARAHMLRPRFIAYADSDPVEITAVLTKMLDIHAGSKKGAERY